MISQSLFNALNYLVPATGSTRAFPISQDFTIPFKFDWSKIPIDDGGISFVPSGVFIDNTNGSAPLTVTIDQINFNIVCPAGGQRQVQYPAPLNQSVTISGGGGIVTVIFVDFPVIPLATGVGGTAPPGNVTLVTTRAGISSNSSVGNASAQIIAAGTFTQSVTIENTHAAQTLSVSFNNPATAADFTIQPGAALTLPFGPTNALFAIGSAAATTFALVGA